MKNDDGVWQLTGTDPTTFDIKQFDPTINIVSRRAVAVLDNAIYAMTRRGVEVWTESGRYPTVVSQPINRDLLTLRQRNPNFDSLCFAVAYESEHTFILCVPNSPSDTACSLQYVYNSSTGTWTRWKIQGLVAANVNSATDKLFLATLQDLYQERKTFTSGDYQDTDFFGDANPINSFIRFNPLVGDSPFGEKTLQQLYLSFGVFEPTSCSLTLSTDKTPYSPVITTKSGGASSPWGTLPWGMFPWGAKTENFQMRIDGGQQTGSLFNIDFQCGQVGTFWQLQSLEFLFDHRGDQPKR